MVSKIAWVVGLGVGVAVAMGFAVAWYWNMKQNYAYSVSSLLRPFSTTVDPTTGQMVPFGPGGNPPLQCPSGFGVNILAAYSDVVDPYGACTMNPSPLAEFLCNPSASSPGQCTTNEDCPFYNEVEAPYECVIPQGQTQGNCKLASHDISSIICKSPLATQIINGQAYCTPPDLCETGIPNSICAPTSKYQCATRNASATLANACNGQESCSPLLRDFGDYACPSLAPISCFEASDSGITWISGGTTNDRQGYCALPFSYGYQGGVPEYGSSGVSSNANGNVGYSFHGVYTCEPL